MFIDANIDAEFGPLLVDKGIITPDQLREGRNLQKLRGGYLSQRLIELGFINDSSLATFLTCQYGYSYLPLKAYNIDDNALKALPAQATCDYLVFPIEKNDRLLTITMADPLNKGVVEILRQVSHCEIIVFISTRTEIQDAISKYYGPALKPSALDSAQYDRSLRDDLSTPYVSNGLYSGPNRRRYRRVYCELGLEGYLYPNVMKARTVNLSMGGLIFESNAVLYKGTQLAFRLLLDKNTQIVGVMEVVRSEAKKLVPATFGDDGRAFSFFEVGAFFNFLSQENQIILGQFLKQKLPR